MKKYLLNNLQEKLNSVPIQFELEFELDKNKLLKSYININDDSKIEDKFYNLAYFDYLTEENSKKTNILDELDLSFKNFSII